jgi:hypothetical protein
MTLYWKDHDGTLVHKFRHFIGSPSQKNIVDFVVACWEYLLKSEDFFLKYFDTIIIWSDGGGKHFKQSACMEYFATVQSRLQNTKII